MKTGMKGAILATTVGLMFMANVALAQDNSSAGGGSDRAQVVAMHAAVKRPRPQAQTALEQPTSAESSTSSTFNSDQGPGPGAIGPGPGCDLFPAPPSVGASVPLSYFGPPPSDTNRSLVGPVQLLNTGPLTPRMGLLLYRFIWAI